MKKIEDTYYVETVEELRKVQLTQPTENAYKDFQREKKYYKESISNLLPIWELLYPKKTNTFL